MMKKQLTVIIFYIILLSFSTYHAKASTTKEIRSDSKPTYWFSIFYSERFWKVDRNGRIYDIYPNDDMAVLMAGPFVTGLEVDITEGRVISPFLKYLPTTIPLGVFEINLKEKYIITKNSAVVYITDISDIQSCVNTLALMWYYMDSKKIYLFKNGRIYRIKG